MFEYTNTSTTYARNVIKYRVVRDDSVNEYLDKGWELYGLPIYAVNTGYIYQAVVLCKKIETDK